jgi:hypothetical protein
MMDDVGRGAVWVMSGEGTRSTRRIPAAVPLYPPQIPHDLIWPRTLATAVGSRRATNRLSYTMALMLCDVSQILFSLPDQIPVWFLKTEYGRFLQNHLQFVID